MSVETPASSSGPIYELISVGIENTLNNIYDNSSMTSGA